MCLEPSESTIDLKPGVASEIKGEETDDKDSEEPKLEQTTDGEVEVRRNQCQ